ncbi:MAG: DUF2231 domain-containing protein, partial [Thermoleophilia bacterium]|nr:DUF2231 domain-containing protein [Thermoleophilia bacterium]
MTMRIQEIHPAVVHFPVAIFPTAVAFDALGLLTGDRSLMDTGRRLIPLAAAGAALAGVAGLAAQGAVRAEGPAHDHLVTHRTLNMGLTALLVTLAADRVRRERPGPGYLAAGLAGIAAMAYSTYLGGRLVYGHGIGVEAAGGVRGDAAPEIRRGNLGRAAGT